ncbi:MAG: flotillin family protein [Chloroflexi bacterium]|nr:flotillin family protein [Chloroflexota bacterium]OJW04318.1 MAG: flotillin [Chloroflexi bacterium 54-19]
MDPVSLTAIGLAVVLVIAIFLLVSLYRKVGPNQALIVYGRGGTHAITGGGRIVVPFIQSSRELSLELMSFDVAPQQDLYTRQGVAVTVEAVAQIKIKSDPVSIITAAEQLLTKSGPDRENLIRLVMEGHLRGIIGQLTVEEIVKEPEMVGDRMRATSSGDLSKMGLEVVSFTIKEVRDKNEYILNMGKPDIAAIRKAADIAAAEAERDTAIRRAATMREASVARAQADQERVIAETASLARQAEAQRDLELKKAEFLATTQRQKASADKAYDIQTNIMEQQVIAEKVKIDLRRKEEETKVQEAEISRREKELIATVLKQAEVERKRIETLAMAERQRRVTEASGQAEALRVQGEAEADVVKVKGSGQAEALRVQGLAEAEIIRAKGEAEAAAMNLKAGAFHEYNQAAILDKLLGSIPEVVRAISDPLQKVDKITIVSTGDGSGGGMASHLTGDMTKVAAQVPALFESLMGVKISDLMGQVPGIRNALSGPATNSTNGNGHAPVEGVTVVKNGETPKPTNGQPGNPA